MAIKIDNQNDLLELTETTEPATPPAGKVVLYVKSDGKLYTKDEAGVEAQPGLTEIVQDTSPVLGGNLDCDSNWIQNAQVIEAVTLRAWATTPYLYFRETGAVLDEKDWIMRATGGVFEFYIRNDAGTLSNNVFSVDRTAEAVNNVTIYAPLHFNEGTGADYIGIQAPASVTTSVTYTLPEAPASNDYLLKSQTDGTLAWVDPTTVGGSGVLTEDTTNDIIYGGENTIQNFTTGQVTQSVLIGTEVLGYAASVGGVLGNTMIGHRVAGDMDGVIAGVTLVGFEAGSAHTTQRAGVGDGTSGFGYQAGAHARGANCTWIGRRAGFGVNSGFTGDDNVAVGNSAIGGSSGTGVSFNTAVGVSALQAIYTNSQYNSALGYQAGFNLGTTGTRNVFLGYGSGNKIYSGADNICIGPQAGPATGTHSKELFIDVTERDDPLIHADFDTPRLVTIDGDLTVTGTLTGGSGLLSEDADFNIVGGTGAGANLTASSAFNNLLLGINAGNDITSGDSNIAIGNDALTELTVFSSSIAIGNTAGQYITGAHNIAIGRGALLGVTATSTGDSNIAIGSNSGEAITTGDDNIFIGFGSGRDETTGIGNTCVGYNSAVVMNGGSGNVIIGDAAGDSISTGDNNVIIGHQAGPTTNKSNELYINNAKSDTPLIHGNFSTSVVTVNGDFVVGDINIALNHHITYGTVKYLGTGTAINWTQGNVTTIAPSATGTPTFTMTAPDGPADLTLLVINGGATTSMTWPAAVLWAGGAQPDWTNDGTDAISFIYDGTYYIEVSRTLAVTGTAPAGYVTTPLSQNLDVGVYDIISASGTDGTSPTAAAVLDITSGTGGSTTSGIVAAEDGGAINITTGDGGNQDVSGAAGGNAGDLVITLGAGGTGSAQGAGGVLHIRTATGSADPAEMLLYESRNAGLNHRGIKVPASFASSIVYTLPQAPASNDYIMKCQTDGTMAWVNPTTTGAFTNDGGTQFNIFSISGTTGDNLDASGQYNFLAGHNAFPQLTIGDSNVAIGYNVGNQGSAQTGASNVIIGNATGAALTSGAQNILIGPGAGQACAAGSNNIMLGRFGPNANTDYNLFIGVSTGSNDPGLIEGNFGRAATRDGKVRFNANSVSHISGEDANVKEVTYVLTDTTTDATQTELFTFNGATRMVLADDSTWKFEIDVVARRTDADGESAAYHITGVIDRNTGVATTALVGSVSKNVDAEDITAWDVDVDNDTTNGSLRIRVTGQATKSIKWAAFAKTTQLTG